MYNVFYLMPCLFNNISQSPFMLITYSASVYHAVILMYVQCILFDAIPSIISPYIVNVSKGYLLSAFTVVGLF